MSSFVVTEFFHEKPFIYYGPVFFKTHPDGSIAFHIEKTAQEKKDFPSDNDFKIEKYFSP